jgi:hypothetical protein
VTELPINHISQAIPSTGARNVGQIKRVLMSKREGDGPDLPASSISFEGSNYGATSIRRRRATYFMPHCNIMGWGAIYRAGNDCAGIRSLFTNEY